MTTPDSSPRYVLGHADREHDRLDLQGRLYADITRRAFQRAGLEPGMKVLDVGCGSGDVSLLAAELVGPDGSVLGVDRDPASVERARGRADASGMANVMFSEADIEDVPEGLFDALVGRFILMHQIRPAEALATAATSVRPGGVVVMVESNMESLVAGDHSMPHSRLYARALRWKLAVAKSAGADVRAGLGLRKTFIDAGLPAPETLLEAPLHGGPDTEYYRYMAESMRSMLPTAEEFGLDDFEARDLDVFEQDLRDDVVSHEGVLVAWPVVSAWCRKE